jgi:hypothetical protein
MNQMLLMFQLKEGEQRSTKFKTHTVESEQGPKLMSCTYSLIKDHASAVRPV